MCKSGEELVAIIDEMVGSAVSMSQGAHSYETFIRSRDLGIRKIHDLFSYRDRIASAIEDLHKLI